MKCWPKTVAEGTGPGLLMYVGPKFVVNHLSIKLTGRGRDPEVGNLNFAPATSYKDRPSRPFRAIIVHLHHTESVR